MNSSVGLRAMSDSTQQHRRLPDAGNGARAAASGGCFDQSSGSNSHQSAPANAASDPMGVLFPSTWELNIGMEQLLIRCHCIENNWCQKVLAQWFFKSHYNNTESLYT